MSGAHHDPLALMFLPAIEDRLRELARPWHQELAEKGGDKAVAPARLIDAAPPLAPEPEAKVAAFTGDIASR